jgi:hypothetical protein
MIYVNTELDNQTKLDGCGYQTTHGILLRRGGK